MFTIICRIAGLHITAIMICQRSLSSKYPINKIMQPLVGRLFPEGRAPHIFPPIACLEKRSFGFQKVHKVFRLEFPLPYSGIAFFTGSKTRGLLAYPPNKKNSALI
jgi:hypothetical protein